MRTIKFRGKRKDNGEWVYGSLLQCDRYTDIWYQENECFRNRVEVDPKTVGQFVGICDKNGKEIYEGDIVKCGSDWLYKVVFLNAAFKLNRPDGYFFTIERDDVFEIIGNIHDNPELLKNND